jgi:hypothetical protein
MNIDSSYEDLPLRHQLDVDILLHREVHFGGNFNIMLDYYQKGGKGIQPDFDIETISNLAEIERTTQTNLAATLLSGADAEKVAAAREAYKKLRDLYEKEDLPSKFPLLIADLVLSEEEVPEAEINAIVHEKSAIVPSLLELLRSEEFYDPLFPGYGQAPSLAAKCLGLIGDKRAIISLFEAIGEEDFFNEDVLLESLQLIGEPAKKFLLTVVKGRPLNFDNERAAIALIQFREDPEVSSTCLDLLQDPLARKDYALSTYLALACEGLKDSKQREQFIQIAEDPQTFSSLARDIKTVAKSWES